MQKLTEKLKEEINSRGFVRAVQSGRFDRTVKKRTFTPAIHKKAPAIACETFMPDGKALHSFTDTGSFADELIGGSGDYRQTDIFCEGFSATLLRSPKGGVHIKYGPGAPAARPADAPKNYILESGKKYDFLVMLGIQDANGRVHDKKQSKFRQINRFLQIVEDTVPALPGGDLTVWDLCCGKSYLSFAVYHYFRYVRGQNVSVYCVDRKADVISECAGYAQALGWNGMHFICGDIFKCLPDVHPDMVLSLHACDIATDIVLSEAVKNGAKVILSSPCCQHELASQIDDKSLYYVTREPILKQKLSAVLTDALRCRLLCACGYKVTTLEFIDPEDTPKNLMIRAEKALLPKALRQAALEEYDGICKDLHADPTMRRLLDDFLTKTR